MIDGPDSINMIFQGSPGTDSDPGLDSGNKLSSEFESDSE